MGHNCPVCGYAKLAEPPYDKTGCASFEICPSCGTEFGYHDASKSHAEPRRLWHSRSLDNSQINSAQISTETWRCATCGKSHVGVPMSFAAEFPDMYANMKREQRDTRALIGSDQCVIDQQWFFLRGCLEVPILGSEEPFVWGLWAWFKEVVYDEVTDFWTLEGREKLHGPYKGRLANALTVYPETHNLKTEISLQAVGTRPLFRIEETDH
jgi:hypothetical protein